MLKKLLLITLLTTPMFSAQKLATDKIYAPVRLGTVDVQHSSSGFMVNNQPVQPQHMDKELRSITPSKLAAALRSGYIQVDQSLNGQYKLQYQPRLQGGGLLGAKIGFWVGKFVIHGIGQGCMFLAAAATGPAFGPTLAALESTCLPYLEAASNVAGLGGGILLGTVTGPV